MTEKIEKANEIEKVDETDGTEKIEATDEVEKMEAEAESNQIVVYMDFPTLSNQDHIVSSTPMPYLNGVDFVNHYPVDHI